MRKTSRNESTLSRFRVTERESRWARCTATLFSCLVLACTAGGGDVAATGGMSGTGISQGSVSAFGSIFVNGVEWNLDSATIEVDGNAATEADLRLGMVVRVEGDYDTGNLSGNAISVRFDDAIEGPIEGPPVETIPGLEKMFSVLGQTVVANADTTVFAGGASFVGLAANDVVEVSGFVEGSGTIRATRIEERAPSAEVELRGVVANLVANPNGSGIFDLGTIVVRYTSGTEFSDVTRSSLMEGDQVEVEGTLRISGDEVDAERIELEEEGLGNASFERVEIEGIATACAQSVDFCIAGVPVDASGAVFSPMGFVPMVGDAVEVEGSLVSGTLVAERIESEEEENSRTVRIEAAVTSVDALARTLLILGVTVQADGETFIEDKSSIGDESFSFEEITPGDFLEIRGVDTGLSEVRADSIDRDDATAGADDIRLEGPVTELDPLVPSLSILGRSIPLDGTTLYFDATGAARTEEEFFRNPGDVMLDDIARVTDQDATELSSLLEADEVELESP